MVARLLLLRHGRTAWNAEQRYQGQADPPLDEVGRVQALEAAALVAAMAPEVIVSSDLQRAKHTAEKLAALAGLPLTLDERLRERHLGHWQGLTRTEVQRRYPDEFADWLAGRDLSRRGGESRQEVAERALKVVSELPDVRVAVLVTHGATAICLSAALLGLPQTPSVLNALANCHWTELRSTGDDWTLRAHNAGAPGPVIPVLSPGLDGDGDVTDANA